MRYKNTIYFLIIIYLLTSLNGYVYATPQLSKKGKGIIASVNGEIITKTEFNKTLENIYGNKMGLDNTTPPSNQEILDRLINGKLIVQEGKNIGLDSLPEVVSQMESYRNQALMDLLLMKQIQNVRTTEKEINKVYRDLIKEYKIKTIYIEKEEDAKFIEDQIKKENNFEEFIVRMIGEGKAKGAVEETSIKNREINPIIKEVLSKIKVGETSSVIKLEKGFTVIKFIGLSHTDNPEAKENAKREAMLQERRRVLTKFITSLKKNRVKINDNVLRSIDYEAKEPGIDSFLKDDRIVANIKGDKPLSVADLSKAIKNKYFHGMEAAIAGKNVNSMKDTTLDDILGRKMLAMEALRQKIDKTEKYRYLVERKEQEVLFATFVQKVVDPEIKLKEDDLKTYYEAHKFEYMAPDTIKLSSITFATKVEAEYAIDSLRKGMDFNWAKANLKESEQINKKSQSTGFWSMEHNNDIYTIVELPEQVKAAVTGVSSGDYRICARPDNKFMVLYVHELIHSRPQSFDDIKNKISQLVFMEKRNKIITDWFEKLRNASDIKIKITKEELSKIAPFQAH